MDDRLLQILQLVEQKTRNHELVWDAAGDSYRTKIGDYSAVLRKSINPLVMGQVVRMALYNAGGDHLESLDPGTNAELQRRLDHLWDQARKQALHFDESLDEILRRLKAD